MAKAKRIKRKTKVTKLKRPRFGPAKTRGRLNPGTRGISPAYSAYRRPWRQEEEEVAPYSMYVENFTIVTNLTGQTFNYAYDYRSHIGTGDVMVFTAQDIPRLEADGILFESWGGNILLQSRNLSTSPWNQQLGGEIAQDVTGVDGTANKAWTLGDANNSGYSYIEYTWDIEPGDMAFVFSIFIKKDSDESRFPEILTNCMDGANRSLRVQFNTSTGATFTRVDTYPDAVVEVIEYTDWWRLIMSGTDDGSNSRLRLQIYPAVTTVWEGIESEAQGEIIVDCPQMEISDGDTSPYPGSPIGTSYINNDGAAQGSEDCSEPDCDVGNFTMGTGWTHNVNRYEAAAATGDLLDPGVLTVGKLYRVETVWSGITGGGMRMDLGNSRSATITANGTYVHYLIAAATGIRFDRVSTFTGYLDSCSVTEYGNVRWPDSSLLTYNLPPDDLFEEALGSELYTSVLLNTVGLPGYETYTTAALDITQAVNTTSTGTCYYNGNLDLDKLYKIEFDYVLNGGGDPWFRMSSAAALNADLTINVRMAGTGSYTLYATGEAYYGFTNGVIAGDWAMSNLSIKEVTNAHDSGDGLYPAHGTSIIWWLPSFDRDDGGSNNYLNSHAGSTGEIIYTDFPSNPNPTSYPGGTRASVVIDFSKDTWYKLVVQWGYLVSNVSKYRVGYDSGSGVVWGTAQDFDGAYRIGASLILGRTVENPFHIKRIALYEEIRTDEEIDATVAPDA